MNDDDEFSVMTDGQTHIYVRHDPCRTKECLGAGVIYPRVIAEWMARHTCPA